MTLNSTCGKGLVKQCCGGPEKKRGGSSVLNPCKGVDLPIFSYPYGWVSCFTTGIGTHLTQSTTGINSFQLQRGENWSSRGWKRTHGWCTIEMAISCIVKSARKLRSLTDWARSPRAEIFKILRSVDQLVSTNTKWPTWVYMLFVPKGAGHMFMDLGLTLLGLELVLCWLFGSQDPLQSFCRWITVPCVTKLEAKCEKSTSMT